MTRTLRVAAVQTEAHDRSSFSRAWPGIARALEAAAQDGAQLAVLPEGTLPGYVLGYTPYAQREIASALEHIREIAAACEMVVVAGAAHERDGRIYNSAIVVDCDGSVAGVADKHFLWHFDRQWFAPGERIEPVNTSIGCLGVLVCADGRIPLIARALVDRGAELLVMPTAWVTSGRDPENLENIQADLLARVRARENGVAFVAANKCGVELGCVAYCGKSQIVTADGSVCALASENQAQTLAADVELSMTPLARPALRDLPMPHRQTPSATPVRVAVAARDYEDEAFMNERLRMLEAQLLAMPHSLYPARGHDGFSPLAVDDRTVLDPAGLAVHRLAGAEIVSWSTAVEPAWLNSIARARALELRMYLIVHGANGRSFAVDPDGAIVSGTFDGYEIAGFTFDPARVKQTLVAPGTDVRAGLERAYEDAIR